VAGPPVAHIDLVDHSPVIRHVHEAVVDEWRAFERLVGRGTAERHREQELQVLDVRSVDGVELRMPLRAEVVMVHQPILRLGMQQPLECDVGGAHR
jgi:hypothetical protein